MVGAMGRILDVAQHRIDPPEDGVSVIGHTATGRNGRVRAVGVGSERLGIWDSTGC
jgi:hypothetical protein